jgi:hypothetical protein
MKLVVFGQVTQVSNLTPNHEHHTVTQMLPKLLESALPILSTLPRLVFHPHELNQILPPEPVEG